MRGQHRIIFFGTSEFAVPALEALVREGYAIVAIVTNPDEPAGRKQIITPPSVKQWIIKNNFSTELFQPESLKQESIREIIAALQPDLFVVAAYGKIIPQNILDIPRYGALNIHPSLLPHWRGPSPLQYTILNGDAEAGVTIMKIDELMDHGPILAQEKIVIEQTAMYGELHDVLAKRGADLLIKILPAYFANRIMPTSQDDAQATYSKLLKKDDGRIDWSQSAEKIQRMVRAFTPWPSAWTLWPDDGTFLRIRIESASVIEESEGNPGAVWKNTQYPLLISTGNGSLAVHQLTVQGKKSMTAQEFVRGYPKIIGEVFV